MKPRVFIGSSTESLEIAYSIQENLEHIAEVTVWTQGIFELSKYTVDSLVDQLQDSDFGIFVFTPDDMTIFYGEKKNAVRDNVIFELGLFIGKLGKERNFIIIPRDNRDSLRLPSDLLGLTPALYEPNRQDGNLWASLGPACTKIGRILTKLGSLNANENDITKQKTEKPIEYSEGDIKAILQSWMGARPSSENSKVILFYDVDRELKFEQGTTKKYIKEVAAKWRYLVEQEGEHIILFKVEPLRISRSRRNSL